MCGIVGILSHKSVTARIMEALKRLEYRGYDSAGIATLHAGMLDRRRAEGKLKNLDEVLQASPLEGSVGIGHTRWATHGRPSVNNSHPHATSRVAVVHNGIIENYKALKEELMQKGINFESDTDTEVVVQLVDQYLKAGDKPVDAVGKVLPQLRGAFALAFIFHGEDNLLIGARLGSPLAVGVGEGEMFLGSDALALSPLTSRICYLEEGDWVVLTRNSMVVRNDNGHEVTRPISTISASSSQVEKGNHRHFMAKEIHEQPEVVGHTLTSFLDMSSETVAMPAAFQSIMTNTTRIVMTACGTAYYAAYTAKYWMERFARVPVDVEIASELRYREPPLDEGATLIVVSQSGETADTLAAMRYAKSQGRKVIAVVNVPTSSIAREADLVLPTLAGPEIGVASTKAFTCQLATLGCMAIAAGRIKGHLTAADENTLVRAFTSVPSLMAKSLALEAGIKDLAKDLARVNNVLYLGRGSSFPLALEGALKLKEISYIHAEGYAAGELKHGPIALIDENMPVIVIAPYDRIFEKTVSNMQEVAARGGRIVLLTDEEGQKHADVQTMATFVLPAMPSTVTPLVYAVPMQLIAYHTAVVMGTDVDQPRNLAKSVTVE